MKHYLDGEISKIQKLIHTTYKIRKNIAKVVQSKRTKPCKQNIIFYVIVTEH